MIQHLLGFDARRPVAADDGLWDGARREIFLLRTAVDRPLSVDNMVWPSLFDTGQGIGLPAEERARLGLAGLPRPGWVGPNVGLWENLEGMHRYLGGQGVDTRAYTTLAVSWLADRDSAEAGAVGPYRAATEPPRRATAWTLLGYDVADGSLVSGLSNCGYTADEVGPLRQAWAGLLNEWHLFTDLAAAFRFRDLADARVREHAPFFVYGLFLVEGP